MLKNNGDCALPCWWGIEPGKSLNYAAKDMIASQRFHSSIGSDTGFDIESTASDSNGRADYVISVDVKLEEDAVASIKVNGDRQMGEATAVFQRDWQALSLQRVLAAYGKPSRVMLGAYDVTAEPNTPLLFSLELVYEDKGIAVRYDGTLTGAPNALRVCPSLAYVHHVGLLLAAPSQADRYQALLDDWNGAPTTPAMQQTLGLTVEQYYSNYLPSLQQTAGMTVDRFYTTFRRSSTACLRRVRSAEQGAR
jgi:hypothetical protein